MINKFISHSKQSADREVKNAAEKAENGVANGNINYIDTRTK